MYQDEYQSYGAQYWGPGRPMPRGSFHEYEAYGLGVAPVLVTGALSIGSRLVGGIFGGGTPEDWREIVYGENENLGAIMDSCPRAKWFATQMAFAPPAVWEALHTSALQAGFKHLAKAAFDQDLWHFPYYVFESTCNPGRSQYTQNAVKIAEQIEVARRESGVVTPAMIELGIVTAQPGEGVEEISAENGERIAVVNGAPPQLAGILGEMGPMLPWILGAGALLFLMPRRR